MFSFGSLLWRLLVGPADDMQDVIDILQSRNGALLAERASLLGEVEALREEVRALRCVMAVRELEIPKLPGEVN